MSSPASSEIELELTYLAGELPDLGGLSGTPMEDVYFPDDPSVHPRLRLRRKGDNYELTKKIPVDSSDASRHAEMTISLSEIEYVSLTIGHARKVTKTRYVVPLGGRAAEVDVFEGALAGLVLIDFEFESEAEMRNFAPPPECLAEVTQEDFIAGGLLAGKAYSDIADELARFKYIRVGEQ